MNKKTIVNQKYESYWQLTMEFTDIYGAPFNFVLAKIVEYIDKYSDKKGLSPDYYSKLQDEIYSVQHKNKISIRKAINQMFKLGFINNHAISYHKLTKQFLSEKDKEQKRLLYSKIVYDNSSFSRSYSNPANFNQMNFLIKTIDANQTINKDELLAIMFSNVFEFDKGYMNPSELKIAVESIKTIDAMKRKYNQVSYLFNLCKRLTNIYSNNDVISLDPSLIMDKSEFAHKGRDPYLQRLYKIELMNEEKKLYNDDVPKCVLEHRGYPVLIASHIKPYHLCDEEEQFDKNNGLLLSKNMDSLFDGGYITFDKNGNVITSVNLNDEVADYVKQFKIDDIILNSERQSYMEYHRKNVFLG